MKRTTKLVSVLLAVLIALSSFAILPISAFDHSSKAPGSSYEFGDINRDGVIDIMDATLIQKLAAERVTIDDEQKILGDVNGDGEVDIIDATFIQKFVVERIDKFPVEDKIPTEPTTGEPTTVAEPTEAQTTVKPTEAQTTAEPTEAPEGDYYILGTMNGWSVSDDYKLTANEAADGEYMFTGLELKTTDKFKVAYSVAGAEPKMWFPNGYNDNYGQNGEITADGTYDLYFRPDGQGGEDWFKGVIYLEAKEAPTAEPDTTAKPEPDTTVKPEPDTTVKPEPDTTVKPEPQTTVMPEPDTTVAPEPGEEGYYIVGTMTDWGINPDYKLTANEAAEGEYMFTGLNLTPTDQFKVVYSEDGSVAKTWYPEGMDNNFGQNGEIKAVGVYDIYFRPDGQGGEDWFNGVIYAANQDEPQPTEEVTTAADEPDTTAAPEPGSEGYYIVGTMTDWGINPDYKLTANEAAEGEYMFTGLNLTPTDQFKVVYSEDGLVAKTWYPEGMDNNFGQNGEIKAVGVYDIYFRPDGQGGEDWFHGVIYAANQDEPQPTEEVTTAAPEPDTTAEPGETITVKFTDALGWGDVNVYYWPNGAEWPGTAMAKAEVNDYGQQVYTAEIPADVTGIIFNGNGNQTVDIKDGIADGAQWYTIDEKEGTAYKVVLVGETPTEEATTAAPEPDTTAEPGETITVKFTDALGWGAANVYYWPNGAEWPGTAMTKAEVNDYGQQVYTAEIPADVTGIIFNGNGKQTVDIKTDIADGAQWYTIDEKEGDNYKVVLVGETPTEEVTTAAPEPDTTVAPEPGSEGFYIVGTMTDWGINPDYKLTANEAAEGEYMFTGLNLTPTDQFKVVYSEDGLVAKTWYPEGMDNNFGQNGEIKAVGVYDIYFRPDGQGGEDWFHGVIYAANQETPEPGTTAADEPDTTVAPEPGSEGYYIVGTMTDWGINPDYKLTANEAAEGEYMFTGLNLTPTDQFKVVYSEDGLVAKTWYPEGMDNNFGQNGEIKAVGVYDIYFRPDGQGGEDWFHGVIYAANQDEPQPTEEVTTAAPEPDTTAEPGETITVKFTDALGWGAANVYYWPNGAEWPGTAMTKAEVNDYGQQVYTAEIPADVTGIIFNGNGNQTVDIKDGIADGAQWYTIDEKEGKNYKVTLVGSEPETEQPTVAPTEEATTAEPTTDPEPASTFLLTDNFGWGKAYVYAWNGDGNALLGEWPGTEIKETQTNDMSETQFVVEVPAGAAGVIVNNGTGAQTEDITDFSYDGYWMDGTTNELGHYLVTGYNVDENPTDAPETTAAPEPTEEATTAAPEPDTTAEPGETITVKFTDALGWGAANVYYWPNGAEWPGTAMTKAEVNDYGQQVYTAEIPADVTGIIFSGNGNQTVDIKDGIADGAQWYTIDEKEGNNYKVTLVGTEPATEQPTDATEQPTTAEPTVVTEPTEEPTETTPANTITVKFTDALGWGAANVYYWPNGAEWPGTAMEKAEVNDFGQQVYTAEIPADVEGIIFNGNGNQTVDIKTDIADGAQWYTIDEKEDNKYKVTLVGSEPATEQPTEVVEPTTEAPTEATDPTEDQNDTITIKFTDALGWGDVHVYYWNNGAEWPGTAMAKAEVNDFGQQVYTAEIPADVEGIIFNGNGNQTVDIKTGIADGAQWYTVNEKEGDKYKVTLVGEETQPTEDPTPDPEPTGTIVKLQPNSNWTQSGARFAIYVFNDSTGANDWADMTAVGDGTYTVTIPEGTWDKVIFVRMNPSAKENNWNNKWNQSANLDITDGKLYTVPSNSWDYWTA